MILTGARAPVAHLVLERIVNQGQEAQLPAPVPAITPVVDPSQQVGHVRADGALGVPAAGLAPGPALEQGRVGRELAFELVLGLEAGYGWVRGGQPTTCADQCPP